VNLQELGGNIQKIETTKDNLSELGTQTHGVFGEKTLSSNDKKCVVGQKVHQKRI